MHACAVRPLSTEASSSPSKPLYVKLGAGSILGVGFVIKGSSVLLLSPEFLTVGLFQAYPKG